MNAIERGLHRGGIPLEKAASYFVRLKNFGGAGEREEAALRAECEKQAADQTPMKTPLAEEAPADTARVDPQPQLNVKSAALRFRLLAQSFKKQAADETTPSEDSADAALASPTPTAVPPKDDYLANEAAGMEAEATSALQYYQARLEEARAETAAAQEQAQQLQQQVEQLTMAQEQHDAQVSAAQQEGQIAQQAAMQQIDAANLAATQAMQQAVQASNNALQAKGQEAAAKIEVQGVRSQLFEMASQGLPGTEPQLGGEGGAAQGMEPLEPAAPEPAAEAGTEGADGGEGAPDGEEAPAEGEGGEEGAAVGSGAPDSGMNQTGESASSDGMPGSQGATEPAASAAPNSVAPQGEGGSEGGQGSPPQSSSSSGGSSSDAKRSGQISIKVGSAQERRSFLEQRLPWLAKTAGLDASTVGALAGGALGAGAAALEGAGHGPDLGKMREDIAAREAAPKRTGLRGFGDALSLVQQKARLGLGEATQAHPIPATIVGGLSGAAIGASAGPKIRDLVREAATLHRGA